MTSIYSFIFGEENSDEELLKKKEEDIPVLLQTIENSTVNEEKIDSLFKLSQVSGDEQYRVRKMFSKETVLKILQLLDRDKMDLNPILCEYYIRILHNLSGNLMFLDELLNNGLIRILLGVIQMQKESIVQHYGLKYLLFILKLCNTKNELLNMSRSRLQQNILSFSGGIVQVFKCVSQHRTKHDALLFLYEMTTRKEVGSLGKKLEDENKHNEFLKILVFKGLFDLLINVILQAYSIEDGGSEEDEYSMILCFGIMSNVIQGSPHNQKMFLDPKTVKPILSIFFKLCSTILSTLNTTQSTKVQFPSSNHQHQLLFIIQMFMSVITLGDVDLLKPLFQAQQQGNLMQGLIRIALATMPTFDSHLNFLILAQQQSLMLLHQLFKLGDHFQQSFLHIASDINVLSFNSNRVQCTALVRLFRMATRAHFEKTRELAFKVMEALLENNQEAQFFVVSNIKPPHEVSSTEEEGLLCGISIAQSIFSCDKPKNHPYECFYVCDLLYAILRQSRDVKMLLLEKPYENNFGKHVPFFNCVVRCMQNAIQNNFDDTVKIGLLKLLCEWVYECTPVAVAFVEQSNSFMYLLNLLQSDLSEATPTLSLDVRGLASTLVSLICCYYTSPVDESPNSKMDNTITTKRMLYNQLIRKISNEQLLSIYQQLKVNVDEILKEPEIHIMKHDVDISIEVNKSTLLEYYYNNVFSTRFVRYWAKIEYFLGNPPSDPLKVIEAKEKERQERLKAARQEIAAEQEAVLEDLRKKHADELAALSLELERKNESLEKLQEENEFHKTASERKAKEEQESLLRIDELEKQLLQKNREHNMKDSTISNLEERLQNQEDELNQLESNREELESQAEELQQSVKQKQMKVKHLTKQTSELTAIRSKLEQTIHQLEHQLSVATSNSEESEVSKKEIEQLEQKVQDLQEQHKSLSHEKSDAQEKLEHVQSTLAQTQSNLESLKQQLSEKESELVERNERYSQIMSSLHTTQSQLEETMDEQEEDQKKMEALQHEMATKDAQLEKLSNQLAQMSGSANEEFEQAVQQHSRQVNELRADYESKIAKLQSDSENTNSLYMQKINQLQTNLMQSTEESEQKGHQLHTLQQQAHKNIQERDATIQKQGQELATYQQQYGQLQQQHDQFKQQYDQFKQQYDQMQQQYDQLTTAYNDLLNNPKDTNQLESTLKEKDQLILSLQERQKEMEDEMKDLEMFNDEADETITNLKMRLAKFEEE